MVSRFLSGGFTVTGTEIYFCPLPPNTLAGNLLRTGKKSSLLHETLGSLLIQIQGYVCFGCDAIHTCVHRSYPHGMFLQSCRQSKQNDTRLEEFRCKRYLFGVNFHENICRRWWVLLIGWWATHCREKNHLTDAIELIVGQFLRGKGCLTDGGGGD